MQDPKPTGPLPTKGTTTVTVGPSTPPAPPGPPHGNPCAAAFWQNGDHPQKHNFYLDSNGTVHDVWFNYASNGYGYQTLNDGGVAGGPPAALGNLDVWAYRHQFHIFYRSPDGTIWDPWWNDASLGWTTQRINMGGCTTGPYAVGQPTVNNYHDGLHVFYRAADGTIWDSWYASNNTWNLQRINNGGVAGGPAASSDVSVTEYNDQQHVIFCTPDGHVWDCWFNGPSNGWTNQQLNLGGNTGAPAALPTGRPCACWYQNQQHNVYRDNNGILWDCWYNGANNGWTFQQINGPGGLCPGASPAVADPVVVQYNGGGGQLESPTMRVIYTDAGDNLWDCFYDSGDCQWHSDRLNGNGRTSAPGIVGTPCPYVFQDNGDSATELHLISRARDGSIWDITTNTWTPNWSASQLATCS